MKIINEMALDKSMASDKCYELGQQFVKHFDKIYNETNNDTIKHHAKEMQAWYDKVCSITLKQNNKKLSKQQLIDWFFTVWGDPKDYFTNVDKDVEEDVYDDFYLDLFTTGSVVDSLANVELLNDKYLESFLTEGLIIYQDEATGKKYVWDGNGYVDYDQWKKQMQGDKQKQSQGGGDGDEPNEPNDNPDENDGGDDGGENDGPQQPPTIGGKGNKKKQEEEEKARQEQIEKEAAEAEKAAKEASDEMEKGDSDEAQDSADNLDKIGKSAAQIKKELKDAAKKGDKINPKEVDDLAERVKKIQDAFEDEMTKAQIVAETDNKINKEKLDKEAEAMRRFRESPVQRFKDSLGKFIAKETAIGRAPTWKKFNKTYANSPIIKQGKTRGEKGHIPLINVYFDHSGSWDDPNKIAAGMQGIGTLNKYVQRGEIKIEIYYFGDEVHRTPKAVEQTGQGTRGEPIMKHIKSTKPDNVIIMTDHDIDDIREPVQVPGAVWLLFKGGRSDNLIDMLHGKKQTKVMDL